MLLTLCLESHIHIFTLHTLVIRPGDMVSLAKVRVPVHSIAIVLYSYIRLIYELIRFETEYKTSSLVCECQLLHFNTCTGYQAGMGWIATVSVNSSFAAARYRILAILYAQSAVELLQHSVSKQWSV